MQCPLDNLRSRVPYSMVEVKKELSDISISYSLRLASGCVSCSTPKRRFNKILRALQAEVAQSPVVIGAPALGPVEETIRFVNSHIVDGRITVMHNPFGVEFPVFVSIRTVPLPESSWN